MIVLPYDGDFIALDTETTGLVKPSAADINIQPYITEICAMRINSDFELVGEVNTFVKPPIPIPEEVIKITGITDEMVKDAPEFIEIVDDLIELFLGVRTFVAHNAPFDADVLKFELMRHGLEFKFPWTPRFDCTVELSYPIRNRNIKLSVLHEIATGKPHINNAHRAGPDVHALIRCYRWLIKNGFVK